MIRYIHSDEAGDASYRMAVQLQYPCSLPRAPRWCLLVWATIFALNLRPEYDLNTWARTLVIYCDNYTSCDLEASEYCKFVVSELCSKLELLGKFCGT